MQIVKTIGGLESLKSLDLGESTVKKFQVLGNSAIFFNLLRKWTMGRFCLPHLQWQKSLAYFQDVFASHQTVFLSSNHQGDVGQGRNLGAVDHVLKNYKSVHFVIALTAVTNSQNLNTLQAFENFISRLTSPMIKGVAPIFC